MNNNITPQDIVSWFREQARKFTETANQVEMTFNGGFLSQAKTSISQASFITPAAGELTPESVRKFVADKNQRVAVIAKHFNATEKTVREIIEDPTNRLQIAERGWVKLLQT